MYKLLCKEHVESGGWGLCCDCIIEPSPTAFVNGLWCGSLECSEESKGTKGNEFQLYRWQAKHSSILRIEINVNREKASKHRAGIMLTAGETD